MKVDLSGKTAVIWGAGSSIGRETAARFASGGAALALCDIDDGKSEEVAEKIRRTGCRAIGFKTGRGSVKSVSEVMKEIHGTFSGPDILVNVSAGMSEPDCRSITAEFSRAEWERRVDDELRMVYSFSKAVIPYMQEKGGGSIINVASAAGLVPLQGQCAASAAQAGIISFSKAIAIELAQKDVRVNTVVYGFISNEGMEEGFYGKQESEEVIVKFIPQKRAGRPEDVAAAVLCLADGDMSYVTGCVFTVDGGWSCGYARNF